MRNPVSFLRKLGLAEGVSTLVLFLVCMPLKYAAGMPLAVTIGGWIHGALFVVLCASLLQTMLVARWPIGRGALVFFAALIPFGPFVIDKRMKGYEREFGAARSIPDNESVLK